MTRPIQGQKRKLNFFKSQVQNCKNKLCRINFFYVDEKITNNKNQVNYR